MQKKFSGAQLAIVLIIAIAVSGIGGYLMGSSMAVSRNREERELNILLNRSEMDALGEIEGTIYVTGHKSPDADTVGSSIAYAELLKKLGYDAKAVVLGTVNNETKYILNEAGVEVPELLEDASGCDMVLVDHSDYEQSAEGLRDAHIIGIIDHHGDGSVRTGNQLIYDARPLGATATIIWMRYRNYGLEPDSRTALVMIGGIFSDTYNLQNKSTTYADKEAVRELAGLSGISDLDTFWKGIYDATLSYEGMTDKEIFFSDYKEYESAGIHYGIGSVKAGDVESAESLAGRMKETMPSALTDTGMDMEFAQITVKEGDLDYTYLVPSDDTAAEVLEAAFGETAAFDGTSYVLSPGVSRKAVVVPAINDVLNAHPRE